MEQQRLRIPILKCVLMSPLFLAMSLLLLQPQARGRNQTSRRCCDKIIPQ
jgi:hypothetical protein